LSARKYIVSYRIVECYKSNDSFDKVERCFNILLSNEFFVKFRPFDKFLEKNRSTLLPKTATMLKQRSTLLKQHSTLSKESFDL